MNKTAHYDDDHAMECVNHKTVETRLSFTTSSLPLTFVTFVLSESLGTFVLSESLGTFVLSESLGTRLGCMLSMNNQFLQQGCIAHNMNIGGKLNCRYNITIDVSLLPATLMQKNLHFAQYRKTCYTCDLRGLIFTR